MGLYVQYGCGLEAHPDWLNFDASPRLRLERTPIIGQLIEAAGRTSFPKAVRFGDIVTGLPVSPGSVAGVYASHVLEHIDRSSVKVALRNSLNMLRPGGTFRAIVPDLVSIARLFLAEADAGRLDAADRFMRYCCLGEERPRLGLFQKAKAMWSHAGHKWMYDATLFKSLIDEAGFVQVRQCAFNDSADPKFAEVEHPDRFSSEGLDAIAFEAVRP